MNNASKPKRADKKVDSNEDATITWGDILQTWELEAKGEVKSEIRMDFNAEDLSGTEEGVVIANGGVKRKRLNEVQSVFPHRRKSKPTIRPPRST